MAMTGFRFYPQHLSRLAQEQLLTAVRAVIAAAPLYTPTMPRTGRPMSVQMTNCGSLGWVTDKVGGYRYQAMHPHTKTPWPPMPQSLLVLWNEVGHCLVAPEACLVNYYAGEAKLGLHQDADEEDTTAPVVSVSLGDDAWFRIGGVKRTDPTERLRLRSGDVVVLAGPARMAFHGVDRIIAGSSRLLTEARLEGPLVAGGLPESGRLNLTLRRVTALEPVVPTVVVPEPVPS